MNIRPAALAFRSPQPEPALGTARELAHAADILYSTGERDLVISFMTDLAKESNDVASVAAVGQVTARYNDAQTMLLIGKTALARGMAMDQYAFPDIGVPLYDTVGRSLIAAWSIQSCAPRAALTSTTSRRPKRWG
jgi:soluble lytic murein transglycosylase